jgi:hypothetical protein
VTTCELLLSRRLIDGEQLASLLRHDHLAQPMG